MVNKTTRIVEDDRDGTNVEVTLTAPEGTRQQVRLPRRVIVTEERNKQGEWVQATRTLESVEVTLWPFCD